ncbi:AbrB family transcriptional regulator [Alkalibacterium putridalgicola]|jgi:hypothetical protein|uniref:type II toxin-antitoxin system PemI/MazE family antitoxin n=1 Tax=Alkalibacterium putridalgicola TaxID=426703 RepID=UPI0034CFC6FF
MKTRKLDNAILLPVPSKFNIKSDQEYVAIKGEMGSLTYVPKMKNIFREAVDNNGDLRFEDEFEDDARLMGREEV